MKHATSDSGNVLFLILIGIALFAAFTMAVTRTSRTDTGNSPQQDKLDATRIMQYGGTLKSAVELLRGANGISEGDISFANGTVSGYGTVGANPTAEVFNASGGAISYEAPETRWLDGVSTAQTGYGEWIFTGTNKVRRLATDCEAASCAELLAILPYIKKSVCLQLNKAIVNDATVHPAEDGIDLTKFQPSGYSFVADLYANGGQYDGLSKFCIFDSSADRYFYVHVLIAR